MFSQYNFETTKKHMEAFWNKDYYERCSLSIVLKNPSSTHVNPYKNKSVTVKEKYLDYDYVYERCLEAVNNSIYMAEAFPVFYTNFGTAAHCSYFGSEPDYSKNTVWFNPCLEEADIDGLVFDINNCPQFDAQISFMKNLSEKSKGRFMVGMNDNCGITDALAEIRGNDNLLMDLITDPDFVKEGIKKVTAAWKATQSQFFEVIRENNDGGSSHGWMNTWHSGRHAQIQCDFSVMISPNFFEEFVLPELIETSEFLDGTSYHLDGQEQLRHLDYILSIETIDNIQWTPVAGQPPTSEFIEPLKKIQAAGKGLILIPKPQEVPFLLENLSHKGLHLVVNGLENVEQAEQIIKLAEKTAH